MTNPALASDELAGPPSDWMRRRRLGQQLGRYVLGTLLGQGGAASVYMARLDGPHGFERVVAVKLVHEHLLADRDFSNMFLDEANLACRLQHPNIVHCYELCKDDHALYLAMEFLQGQPLSRVYQRAREWRQPLPYSLVAWIGARAADALGYAHDLRDDAGQPLGVVHRDVSPDNLFITYDGQVKLLDFGIARAAGRRSQTNLGQLKGKFRYMAPEYAMGLDFDGGLDVFALGATLYEAATGVPAFDGDEQQALRKIVAGEVADPRDVRADFPAPLWKLLQQAMSSKPEHRPRPAAQFAKALDGNAGLTQAQGRALLSSAMRRLFPDELGAEASEIAELRRLSRGPDEPTAQGHTVSRVGLERPRPRAGTVAWTLGFVVAGGAVAVGLTRAEAPLPAVAAPAALPTSSAVDVAVQVFPAEVSGLRVSIGGQVVPSAAPHRAVPRGTDPVWVEVSAPGYRSVMSQVVPDRERSVVVTLLPVPAASVAAPAAVPAKPSAAPRAPGAAPSGVIRRYPF